ncbi:MAG: DUF2341 domain-containing protein, partial [Candidatus Hodarchaeota archaeon]
MRGFSFFRFSHGYFKENKGYGNIIQGLLLCIICLNLIIIAIPTQEDSFLESDDIITQLLKGFGLEKKEKQSYLSIPTLTKDHIHDSKSASFNNRFRLSSHYVPGWADTRWQFRKNITIDNAKVSSDLNNFPVYIDLYDSDLQNEAQAGGGDIFFSNASGHLLDHEIEVYDRVYNSTHAHLVAWVKANVSSTQDTILSMYYGNPTTPKQENSEAVWDSAFKGIWHLSEDPSTVGPQIKDSTSNDNDGTAYGSMTSNNQIDGKMGGSLDFDGVDDYIYCSNDISLNMGSGDFTFGMWFKISTVTDPTPLGGKGISGGGGKRYTISMGPNTECSPGQIKGEIDDDTTKEYLKTSARYDDSKWYYVVLVRDGTNLRLYLNGTQIAVEPIGTYGNIDMDSPFYIARIEPLVERLNGQIDEVRISNVARTPGWISTEFENQNNVQDFYSTGSEERYSDTAEWQFPGLKYRKSITIDATKVSGSGSLSNFPLAIDLFDTDLHISSKVQADGDDIIFTDSNGNKLDHEIEKFNQNSNATHAHLVAWVKIPSLSTTIDTQLFMYFGNPGLSSQANPSAVWNSNYKGVWHLNQDPAGTPPQIIDSTSNNNDGTSSGLSSGDLTTGKVDGGLNFPDAGLPYISMGDQASLNMGSGDFSLELWFRYDSADNNAGPLAGKGAYGSGGKRYFIALYTGSGNIKAEIDDDTTKFAIESTLAYGDDIWHHAVMVRDGNWLRFYIDGAEIASPLDITGEGSLDNAGMPFTINTLSSDQGPTFSDDATIQMDEVRVSNIAHSASWISTEYNNQNNTNEFYSVGSLEIYGNWALPYLRYRKDIVIDSSKVSGTGNLYNFPMLIDLYDSDLYMTEKVQSNGNDIAFTDGRGARLDHEIELFDQAGNGTHAHLLAWVKIPVLSGTIDTTITIWYGNSAVESLANPGGVWEDFGGVWHLDDDFLDSTSNNNDGTNYQSTDISGQIYDGQDFDGVDDYINTGSGSSIDNIFSGGGTISVWIHPEGWGGASYGRILDKSLATSGTDGWVLCLDGVTGSPPPPLWTNQLLFYRDFSNNRGLWMTGDDTISLDQWQYIVISYDDSSDSNDPVVYINGVLQTVTEDVGETPSGSASSDAAQSLYIGNFMGGARTFDGGIDEIRVSSGVRTIEWVLTEYNNQLNPESFISVGNETQRLWADATFSYSKDIVINPTKVPEDSENFPVLLDIADSGLKNGIVQPNGADILFFDPSGTKLDYEIESFQQNSTYGHLIAWVKVPHIFSTDYTTVSMYYGNKQLKAQHNPEGVWGSNYGGVWHLNEEPYGSAPQILDSTSNDNDGTTAGVAGSLAQVAGQINGSLSFDDQDNFVNIPNDNSLQFSSDIWVSAWVKTTDTDNDVDVVLAKWDSTSPDQNYFLAKLGSSSTFEFFVDSSESVSISLSKINDGIWHYIVGVADSANGELRLYVDGVLEATDVYDGSSVTSTTPLYIGRNPGAAADQAWSGLLDECRVSNNIHSENWILTEYNNQNDTTNFYSLSSEFSLDVSPPIITGFGVEDLGTGIGKYWADITDSISDVSDAKITINGTEYDMSFNGSLWIYNASIIFGGYYEYQITNTSDVRGNFLTSASTVKQVTFINDYIAPNVDQWNFDDAIGPYGTFKANVSDPWGDLDTVIVNITELNSVPRNDLWAVMRLTASGYMNDTISMPGGSTFWYVITVNDTAGNSNTTSPIPDVVPDFNSPPEAQNVTLSRDIALELLPVYSNCSL